MNVHLPQLSNRDFHIHFAVCLAVGTVTGMLGSDLTGVLVMWAGGWIFECLRDPRC